MNANFTQGAPEDPYVIRDVTTSDAASYRQILLESSGQDRYFRFFHHVTSFDDSLILRQLQPRADVCSKIAVEGRHPLGIAQAFIQSDGTAELAVIVAALARRCGVATSLLSTIVATLQRRRITRLVASSLVYNAPFTLFATANSMRSESADEDGIVAWSLDLQCGNRHAMQSQCTGGSSLRDSNFMRR